MASARRDFWEKIPVGTLLLGCFAAVLFFDENAADVFSLRRDAMAQGAWWQWMTGHFTHWDRPHFLWDFVVFLVVGARCELFSKKAFWWTILGGSWLLSLVFVWAYPSLTSYRGLSGLDSALFALLLTIMWYEDSRLKNSIKLLLTLGFLSKMVHEMFSSTPIFVPTAGVSFATVPLVHVAGAVWGVLVGLFSVLPGVLRAGKQVN